MTSKHRIYPLALAVGLAAQSVQAQIPDGFMLEEIVVTAQKREQNLQDVPIAVTAFSGEQLREAVVKDIFDLQNSTPGLQSLQEGDNSSSSFRIRGIGTSGLNFGLESSVGMYVDGVYRSRQSSMISDMIDIEAVEVLRGPQGTLFGKNTPQGAIQFRTTAPSHETDGFLSVTGGNYGLINAAAAGNLSLLEDVLAIRGTVFSSQRDGVVDATGFGDELINDRNREGVRLQALYTPNDELSIRLIADYSEIDEVCCAVLTAVDTLTVTDPVTGQSAPGSDWVIRALGGTALPGDNTDSFNTALNFLPESDSRDRGLSLDVNWDLGDYALTSVTAYRKFNAFSVTDVDFTDVDLITRDTLAESSTFSQELRLDISSDSVTAVVGAYYFRQNLDSDHAISAGHSVNDYILAGSLGEFTNGMAALNTATGGLFPATATPFPVDMTGSHTARQEQESWALFGQMDINLSDQLILTVGLRYTEEDKKLTSDFRETIGGQPLAAPGYTELEFAQASAGLSTLATALSMGDFSLLFDPAFMGQYSPYTVNGWGAYLFPNFTPRDDIDTQLDDEQITGTIKLSWFVSEDTMLYASYGTGYKSGGTNTDRIAQGFDPLFDAETSQAFEVGVKAEFPEQALRLNAAAHLTRVDDFQSNSYNGTSFTLQNAGELESYGTEIELFWIPSEHTEVSLSYAYSHAQYKSFEQAGCWVAYTVQTGIADPNQNGDGSCDRSGDRLVINPENVVNLGAKQSFSLADGVEGYVYGDYTFLSDQVLGNNNDPLKSQSDYGILNLRAGLNFEDSDLQLTLWGRNVLDKSYKGSTFDAPLQDGKLLSSAGNPRTFGVTLNKAF